MADYGMVDVQVTVLHATERAVLVKCDCDDGQCWLPFSQIEGIDPDMPDEQWIEIKEWLAEEKGIESDEA